jgi:hypothetical protein
MSVFRLPEFNIKMKGKVVPVHATQANKKNGDIAPLIFNLGTSDQPHAPAALPPGKELQYP